MVVNLPCGPSWLSSCRFRHGNQNASSLLVLVMLLSMTMMLVYNNDNNVAVLAFQFQLPLPSAAKGTSRGRRLLFQSSFHQPTGFHHRFSYRNVMLQMTTTTTSSSSSNSSDENNSDNETKLVGAVSEKGAAAAAGGDNGKEEEQHNAYRGTLRVDGPDAKGIVAAFTQTLYGHGCGVVESEQHTDYGMGANKQNRFFQRIVFDYGEMHTDKVTLEFGINEVSERLKMDTDLDWNMKRKRMAILVSKYDHCLWELLLRHQAGEFENSKNGIGVDISCIISNHPDLKYVADAFNIPFHHYPINKSNRTEVEQEELELLKNHYDVDLVVLARYMQIISDNFCTAFTNQVINIHHSFLPAFVGGKPYHRAHERGVKLIGATAHYANLDEGPIVEQDICRISHRDSVPDLVRKGRTLEKNVLVHAVKAHLEDRIIVYNNKCVVFDG